MRFFGLFLLLLQFHHLATSHPHHNLQSSGNGGKQHSEYKGSDMINKLPTKLEGGRVAVVIRRGGGGGGGGGGHGGGGHGGGGDAAGHGRSGSNGGYEGSTKPPGSRGTAAAGWLNYHHIVQNCHPGRNGGGHLKCIVPFTLASTILTLVTLIFST